MLGLKPRSDLGSPGLAALGLLALLAAGAAASADEAPPVPVSPGAFDRVLEAPSCPTFSWGSEATTGHSASRHQLELAVERASPDAQARFEPLYRIDVPARARSWTPSTDRCAPPGGSYSWRIRSESRGVWGPWSEAARFSVAPLAATSASIRHLLATSAGATSLATDPLRAPADKTTEASLVAEPVLNVDGVLAVGELRSLFDAASFGAIETTVGLSVALGPLEARTLRVNTDTVGTPGVQLLTNSQFLLLDTAGGGIVGDGELFLDELFAETLIVGLPITTGRSGWYPPGLDGGGEGFAEVDADNVKLDTSGESCFNAPVQGVRLRIVDGDQIGVQLQCANQ